MAKRSGVPAQELGDIARDMPPELHPQTSLSEPSSLTARALSHALVAIEHGADTDLALRLAAEVARRDEAERELSEAGINPSPADIEAWIAASSLQRHRLREAWDVMRVTDALRKS